MVSDQLVKILALFVHKVAEARLPMEMSVDQPPVLKPVDPTNGWLVQRWHLNQPKRHVAGCNNHDCHPWRARVLWKGKDAVGTERPAPVDRSESPR